MGLQPNSPIPQSVYSLFVRYLTILILAILTTMLPRQSISRANNLDWMFLDLNSYFASVEQETRPELRGRPVAVVPVMADSTCCIAASYEAKAFGVRTGTGVKNAKQLCPAIELVEARHELYVQYHHRIVEAVESCIPVALVVSVDEMACRLMGRERPEGNALQLATRIKQIIREKVGSTLRCSIGLAPNRFLAKVGSDMQKPDGLTVIRPSELPTNLFGLKPQDLPGIGPRMNFRLERQGIFTMPQLCALSAERMRGLWGSVVGERFWHCLHGEDLDEVSFDPIKIEPQRSVGHQHVLPPALRTMEGADGVAQKLLHKAGVRLRRMNMWARGISVFVRFTPWRKGRFWEAHTRIAECQDTLSLLRNFHRLWKDSPVGNPVMIGVSLYDLVPDNLHNVSLFSDEQKQGRLSRAMDSINAKYGNNTVYLGGVHDFRYAAPPCIAFSSIPEFDCG